MSALVKASQKAFFNEKPLKVRLDHKARCQNKTVVDVVLGLHGSRSQFKKNKSGSI